MRQQVNRSGATEAETAGLLVDLCDRLGIKPEDIGMQRNDDGTFRLTYVTCKVMEKTAETLRLKLAQNA